MGRKNDILELSELLDFLNESEAEELDKILISDLPLWVPLPGPQLMAYETCPFNGRESSKRSLMKNSLS